MGKKSLFWPVTIGVLIIGIIIYLVASVKQPYVTCNIRHSDDGSVLEESITTTFNSGSISEINYNKIITLTDKYKNVGFSKSLKSSFDNAYNYLGDSYNIKVDNNIVNINITLDRKVPIILDNVELYYNEGEGIGTKIQTNTKASDAIVVSVGDKYSEGEFMTKLKNRGYSCK